MGIRIDPYEQQTLAGGAINSDVPAGAFGAGIAHGLQEVGQGGQQLGDSIDRVEQDQGRIWAATAVSQRELALQQTLQQRVNSLDPTAPDYAQKIASLTDDTQRDVEQAQSELLDQAPGRYAKRFVGVHMANAGLRINDFAMRTQAQLNGDYTKGLVQDGIKADSDILAATPDNDTYARLLQKQHDAVVGLSTIPPNVKDELLHTAAHTYANVQVASLVAKNPQAFLQVVNAQGGAINNRGRMTGQVPTVPSGFLIDAVTQVESRGNPSAVSPKGALGSMQVMPTTAIDPGFGIEPARDQSDGELRRVGTQYLGKLQQKYGDTRLALAAYNAGPGAVDNAMKAASGDIDSALSMLPKETQDYVPKVLSAAGAQEQAQDPQVQPLNEQDIAKAEPPIAGWDKLTWPEKVSYVRQAEGEVGKQLASDRGAITRELQDIHASLLAGQSYPGIDSDRYSQANLERVLGPDQGARAAQQISYDRQVGHFMQTVGTMPAAQRDATLAHLAPTAGTGFAQAEPAYKAAQDAAQRVATAQATKPIQYAIEAGIANAKPLDFSQPETLASQLHDRTVAAATMVRDYGAKAQIFTDDEVKALADKLGNQTGKDRIATLANIRIGLNDPGAFDTAMNQLAPKNPTLAYAGNLAARDGVAYVDGKATLPADIAATIADGDIILNGRSLDKQMAKGDDPAMPGGAKATNFNDTQFRTFFNQTLGGAFRTPDAQLSAAAQQETYNAARAYYAADAYKQGKPLDQIDPAGVQRAIEAVAGQPWRKNGGTLLAPYGMPVEQFQDQWDDRAKGALKAAGYDDTAVDRLLDKTVPINLADGRYGFQNGTRLQTDSRGRPVIVDYRQPYAAPTPPEPTEASKTAYSGALPMMRRY